MDNCWTRKYERTKIKAIKEFMDAWKDNGLRINFTSQWLLSALDVFYCDNEYEGQIDFPRLMCILALISDGDCTKGGYWDIAREIISMSEDQLEIWKYCQGRFKYYNSRGERLLIGENIDVAIDDTSRELNIPIQEVRDIWKSIKEVKAKRIEGDCYEN